jgi:magnesium-transporting ATPase (P-type)
MSYFQHIEQHQISDAEAALPTEVLALTGDTLQLIRKFHPHFMPQVSPKLFACFSFDLKCHHSLFTLQVILQGAIFARVSPLEKQFMVEQFQDSGYQVAMCGDGANDCGVGNLNQEMMEFLPFLQKN